MPRKQTKKSSRARTYASNRAATAAVRRQFVESDGTYFLKLVMVVILGTMWLKLEQPLSWNGLPFGGAPIGTIIGLVAIALLERDQTNRKIWYAVLIIVTIISYFAPAGIVI